MSNGIARARAAIAAAELRHWRDGTHAARPSRANLREAVGLVLADRDEVYVELAQALGRAKVAEREAGVLRGSMRADETRVRELIEREHGAAEEAERFRDVAKERGARIVALLAERDALRGELSAVTDQVHTLMDTVDELTAELEAARSPGPTRSQAMLLRLLDGLRPAGDVEVTTEVSRCVVPHDGGVS